MLLGEFGLHARDGSLEEEGDEVFVCALCADLLEGGDVGCAIFEADNEQGMIGTKEDEVREQAACSSITIAERMEIFEISMPFGCDD